MQVERIKKGPLRIILTEQNDVFNLKRGFDVSLNLEEKILDGIVSIKIEPSNFPKENPQINFNINDNRLTIYLDQGYPLNKLNNLKLYSDTFYKKYKTYFKLVVK